MNLAESQAALVAALVAGASAPPGFDSRRLAAARAALLAKRAQEVKRVWPALCDAYGADWTAVFAAWAQSKPPEGGLRDGWDFALDHPPAAAALVELRVRQALWAQTKAGALRRRRLPVVRLCADGQRRRVIFQIAGRAYVFP